MIVQFTPFRTPGTDAISIGYNEENQNYELYTITADGDTTEHAVVDTLPEALRKAADFIAQYPDTVQWVVE